MFRVHCIFAINDEAMCKKLQISIRSSLSKSGIEYPDPYALSGTGSATSQKTVASQMMPAVLAAVKKETEVTNDIPALTIESSEENPKIIDAEGIACSPAQKRAKIIGTERIIMGEELTDLEINLAQQLLKKQFANINGFQSTLLQDKGPMASNEQKNSFTKIENIGW